MHAKSLAEWSPFSIRIACVVERESVADAAAQLVIVVRKC